MVEKTKVLIVDGKDALINGIKKGLEISGFNVKTAIGGKEAIELAEKEFFDVVLVDLLMSDMDGVETCKGIKKVSSKTEVLLLSEFPTELEKFQLDFINAGGKDLFLRKPLLKNEVRDAINKLLNLI
jgi:DNA-binding response OmpR family regulator